MKIYLKISFDEKDEAKALAAKNGTAIRWDAKQRQWYFEGNSLPTCLERYSSVGQPPTPPMTMSSDGLYYYLVTYSNMDWYEVYRGPYSDKEALKKALLNDIKLADRDLWSCYSQIYAAAATRRVDVHRSLRREWIRGMNSVIESADPFIRSAVEEKNLEYPPYEPEE